MYLKSLELMGFKSFGHKTVFDFQPGMTAIVGPNGSGKSNVCDAIRWVLGEQSARALRGTKMAEVIFAGSGQIRPAAFAQVRITLDNELRKLPIDFAEVSIGRQLYRSGESNYMFNGNRSLLSDIREMLMDTGIGKEGYSVIGQGDIDDIIFQKTQSRRALIEEAASITKYKHRKANTLQKLDNTKSNIMRLQDIIREIENQLGPLAEQAEKTRKHQGLSIEIRGLDIDLILFDLSQLYGESENIDSMRRGLLAKIAEVQAFLAEVGQKKGLLREKLQTLEEYRNSNQLEVRQTTKSIEEIRVQSSTLKEESGGFQARKSAILEELATIDDMMMKSRQEITDAEATLRDEETREIEISGTISGIEVNIKKAQADLEAHLKEASLDKESSFQMAVLMTEKKNRINSSAQQIQMLQRQSYKGQVEAEGAQTQIAKLDSEKGRLDGQITELDEQVSAGDKELVIGKARLQKLDKGFEQCQEEADGLVDLIRTLQARRNILEELKNRGDGLIFRGVKEALSLKNTTLPGIFGMVGDLLTVPKGYETAFETALGGSIQDIITKDADTAQQAIAVLKERRAGRATFLPLDMIQAPSRLENPKVKGCLGVALDLVEYDAKFYTVMNQLLGRILIFDNLDTAVAYSRSNRNFGRIVTLEGDVVRSSGAMTGGADNQKGGGGILARKREMEELDEKITASISREKKASSLLKNIINERNTLLTTTRQSEENLARKRQSLEFFRQSLAKIESELRQKQSEKSTIENDQGDVLAELKRLEVVSRDASAELNLLENQDRELKTRLEALSGREGTIASRMNELKSILSDERMKLVQISERKNGIKKEIASASKRRKDSEERKDRADSEVSRLSTTIETAHQSIAALNNRALELEKSKQDAEAKLESSQEEFRAASKEIEALDHAYQSRAKIEESTRHKLSELDLKFVEIKTNIQNKESVLAGEFNFDVSEPSVTLRKYESREALTTLIADRKRQRELLEPVNPLAIEDYEKTKERYDFLTGQIKDLTDAASSLEQVIAEIDKISKERFVETFAQIDAAFLDIFKILFPGGVGQLKLTDSSDPLTSNVEIICQLPGKKLTTLELFSGGEKALISMALLFSILQVKPPAFCVLDEVEAALDEANVKRFTRMLRTFADKSQFLVITHNKETMQAVDTIYGITLEKSGISRPISIRLEDQEKIKEFTVKR